MRRIVAALFLTVLMGVLTVGCGSLLSGNEFIGKWVNSERSAETLEIKKDGESFIVTRSTPTLVGKVVKNGERKTIDYPATYKDALLTVNTGSQPMTISYVKEGDYLLVDGQKFIKQK